MTSIALCMIVKNEARVIRRCIDSVRPYITTWCICDTGSTDGTQDIIREAMAGILGELHERPWIDQQRNRNEALALARPLADYLLLIDADEELQPAPGFLMPPLNADGYEFTVRAGGWEWGRCQLVSTRYRWRFEGRRHPGLHGEDASVIVALAGMFTVAHSDGASWSDPDKYKRHVAEMEADVAAEPDNPRLRYYLAQSYRDAGQAGKAIESYLLRSDMGGWDEERWSAAYEAAKLLEACSAEQDIVIRAYLSAYMMRPTRAEAPHRLGRYLRQQGHAMAAACFAREAARLPRPADRLFIEAAIYQWQALDELALSLHASGQHAEALEALAEVKRRAPADQSARLQQNETHFQRAS